MSSTSGDSGLFDSGTTRIPAVGFTSFARDGTPLISSFAGATADTVGYLASCTKLLTCIAALQCVERGLIDLDEPVGRVIPRVDELDVLEGFERGKDGLPRFRRPKQRITLRHLLSHTSGLAYAFSSPNIKRWLKKNRGSDEVFCSVDGPIFRPLAFEPGERWRYGPGVDIAGLIVETLTHTTLETYFRAHVFPPGADFSFFPDTFEGRIASDAFEGRLASDAFVREGSEFVRGGSELARAGSEFKRAGRVAPIYTRKPDGQLEPTRLRKEGRREGAYACAGGHGGYASTRAFTDVLLALVNDGVHPTLPTYPRILSPTSLTLLTSPQLDPSRQKRAVADLGAYGFVEGAEGVGGESWRNFKTIKKNHALGGIILGEGWRTGRSGHNMSWSGMCNTNWWIDTSKGVAGFFFAQLVPFGDPQTVGLFERLEGLTYEALEGLTYEALEGRGGV
ncbi:hypothetical protein PLICRDRAFT_51981 [Plicaturopsis crispa FD-325 SS-3]|nr:hypothetical protein PLICRDRAFT_51981 [Plicaturopsis crispa FD-325 SS-3]